MTFSKVILKTFHVTFEVCFTLRIYWHTKLAVIEVLHRSFIQLIVAQQSVTTDTKSEMANVDTLHRSAPSLERL